VVGLHGDPATDADEFRDPVVVIVGPMVLRTTA
jgi:hypothetical protein